MLKEMRRILPRVLRTMAVLALAGGGCKATYPEQRLTQSLEEVCRKEYNLSVTAERQGETLIAYAAIPDLLDASQNISEASMEKVYNVITALARVGMSTDAPLQFLTIVATDPGREGIYLRITRHVYDLKRIFMSDFPHSESHIRTEMELSREFPDRLDITLQDFLAKQLARRVEKGLKGELLLQDVQGAFRDGGFHVMIGGIPLGKPLEQALSVNLKELGKVVKGYGFKDFDEIVIESDASGERLVWKNT